MTTPTKGNPKFVHQDGYTGMIVDDSEKVVAKEIHTNHVTADGTKQRAFQSTEVDENYRGQGLAQKIIQYTVDEALDEGYRIVPICPVVKDWIEKQDDPKYKEAQDTARPEHFQ